MIVIPKAYRPLPPPLARIKRRGWNQRVLSFDDFEQACEDEGVLLIITALSVRDPPGCYDFINETPRIKLDINLRDPARTLVAFHEYGHHCYHVPGHFGLSSKTEMIADHVAFAALIPNHLLIRPDWDIAEEYGYPPSFVTERRRLKAIYHR